MLSVPEGGGVGGGGQAIGSNKRRKERDRPAAPKHARTRRASRRGSALFFPPPLLFALTWKRSGVRPSQLMASSTWSYMVESSATRCAPPWAHAVQARFSTSCQTAVSSSAEDLPAQKLQFCVGGWWGEKRERERGELRPVGFAAATKGFGPSDRAIASKGRAGASAVDASRRRAGASARGARRGGRAVARSPLSTRPRRRAGTPSWHRGGGRGGGRPAGKNARTRRRFAAGSRRSRDPPLERHLELALGADAREPDGDRDRGRRHGCLSGGERSGFCSFDGEGASATAQWLFTSEWSTGRSLLLCLC